MNIFYFFCEYSNIQIMELKKIGLIAIFVVASMACKKKYKNPDPAPAENVYVSKGKVDNKDVAFNSGINGYAPSVMYFPEDNTVSYKFGIRTPNIMEDHFEFNILDVYAGTDSNDTDNLFEVLANKSYTLGETSTSPITYSFSYFKGGVEYTSKKDVSGNITLSGQKDLGDIKAVDHTTQAETSNRHIQFNGKLENVKLYNSANEELLISNFEFLGKLAAKGDLKKKKK